MMEIWEKLRKIKLTEIQMLQDRGYPGLEGLRELAGGTVENFRQHYSWGRILNSKTEIRTSLTQRYDGNIPENNVLVYYATSEGSTLVKESIVKFAQAMASYGTVNGIIIHDVSLNASALQEVKSLTLYSVEFFEDQEMMFNVTNHVLVPKHVLLPFKKSQIFLDAHPGYVDAYTTEDFFKDNPFYDASHLPVILSNDPVAKYYGAKRGQIFVIERVERFLTTVAPETTYFRIVKDPKKTAK